MIFDNARLGLKKVGDTVEPVFMTEEEFVKVFFEEFEVEVVSDKKAFVEALKKGDYVIGIDYNPLVLHNVFHYKNGKFEMYKLKSNNMFEVKTLVRDVTFYLPPEDWGIEIAISTLPHYDEFIVCRNGRLIDTKTISGRWENGWE